MAVLIVCVALFSLDLKNPDDPMFYIVSGGMAVELFRILLACLLAGIPFVRSPANTLYKYILSSMGIILLLSGITGALLGYVEASIKPIDFLMITEAGIIFILQAITLKAPIKTTNNIKPRTHKSHFKLVNLPLS